MMETKTNEQMITILGGANSKQGREVALGGIRKQIQLRTQQLVLEHQRVTAQEECVKSFEKFRRREVNLAMLYCS